VAERLCEKRRVVFSLQLVLWDQFAKFEEMAANKILSLAGCAVGRAHHNVTMCSFFADFSSRCTKCISSHGRAHEGLWASANLPVCACVRACARVRACACMRACMCGLVGIQVCAAWLVAWLYVST
jgi:hypothetical protein